VGYFEGFIGVNLWTALFVLLNTLAVIFVATKFLFKPVMKIIEDRQNEIDDIYAAAGQAQDEANTMREEYAEKLADAQATSERMVKEAVARGQAREEAIIRQANQEASAILDKAAADIELEILMPEAQAQPFLDRLTDMSSGTIEGMETGQEYRAIPI
jgi:F-type H+-transporting ATPase subunit b